MLRDAGCRNLIAFLIDLPTFTLWVCVVILYVLQFKMYYRIKLTNKKQRKNNNSPLLKTYQDRVVSWDLTFFLSLFTFLYSFFPPKPEMGVESFSLPKVSPTVYLATLQQSSDKSLQVQYSPDFWPPQLFSTTFFLESPHILPSTF